MVSLLVLSCLLQSHFLLNSFSHDLHSNFDEYWSMFDSLDDPHR